MLVGDILGYVGYGIRFGCSISLVFIVIIMIFVVRYIVIKDI